MIWMAQPALAHSCMVYADTTAAATFPVDGQLVLFHNLDPEHHPLWFYDEEESPRQEIVPIGRNYSEVRWVEPPVVGDLYRVRGEPVQIVAGGDIEAPEAPGALDVYRVDYDYPRGASDLTIDAELDADASWLEVEIARSADFSDALSFGGIPPLALDGASPCTDYWPEHRHNARYHVRARQVDQTGNRSDWSEAALLRARVCSTAGPTASWVVFIGLALGRRRRSGGTP